MAVPSPLCIWGHIACPVVFVLYLPLHSLHFLCFCMCITFLWWPFCSVRFFSAPSNTVKIGSMLATWWSIAAGNCSLQVHLILPEHGLIFPIPYAGSGCGFHMLLPLGVGCCMPLELAVACYWNWLLDALHPTPPHPLHPTHHLPGLSCAAELKLKKLLLSPTNKEAFYTAYDQISLRCSILYTNPRFLSNTPTVCGH